MHRDSCIIFLCNSCSQMQCGSYQVIQCRSCPCHVPHVLYMRINFEYHFLLIINRYNLVNILNYSLHNDTFILCTGAKNTI